MSAAVAALADRVTLRAGAACCTISPACGGSLAAWTIGEQPLLRTAADADTAARAPLGMASFPLVPYSNRIADGCFLWQGEAIKLVPNFAPEPHAIHGVGWQRPWRVAEQNGATALLVLDHAGDGDWPWPFRAEQRVSLTPTALTLSLSATNLHHAPVPLSFGHHPYFDATGARLEFAAERVWLPDARSLPHRAECPSALVDFSAGAQVEGLSLDHCYDGWNGHARIDWEGQEWHLEIATAPPLAAAVVYVPHGGDAFCFEPVPHVNNALNRDDAAMPVVQPGGSYRVDLRFRAVR